MQAINRQGEIFIAKVNELKSRHAEELLLLGQVENKCSRLLVVVTAILVALAIAMMLKSQSLFSPSLPVEWIRLVALLITVFAFVCSWGHTLLALKIEAFPSVNNEHASSMHRSSGFSHKVSAEDEKALEKLSDAIKEKERNIGLAYEELTMGAWFMGITVAVSIGMKLLS
ncbi:hypothetical protein [Photobacterium sp. J15]|uniref:hypothetical protein n=1 Tax=Photobacterium sp. J15 TaxID=265901 RepID=UPI0007E48BD8|nr:hypothetical protein [Photobacterium sp. J15]